MTANEIISRDEAKARGLKRYFTGQPCKNGHTAPRSVSNFTCWQCAGQAKRLSYSKSPESAKRRRAKYFSENRQLELEKMRAYADANKDAATVGRKKRYAEKRDLLRRQSREWAAANPDKRRAQHAERKARERGAVPPWYGELDSFVLREAADLCILRRNATGFEWHIDHMVPLRAKKASGLHCHTNFQVIPAAMNISKRNKMQLIEPLEWLQKL